MAINNFKPFALDPNANVTSQADWEALPALLSGFTAGKASSAQVNKAIRQASFIAAALAQYTANKSRLDVLDDGDLNGFISKMGTAFGKDFQALDATLSALAGLATGANKLPYFTGNDTAAQTDLTSVGRDIIGKNTIADILTYLGLGTAAEIDVATNDEVITGTANKAVTAAALKNRFNTVILYPNGTEHSPPILTANQRIVIDNPFPGRPVVAQVEVMANGIWAEPYFMAAPYGNSGPVAGATPSYLYETDKIVIQTGNDGVLYRSSISGSAHNLSGGGDAFGGSIFTSEPYRLRVRAI
ncbi:phage tail protein [Escherichia coli]|uniref:phage tail protein n=1 Tax=Escherichia coli TaxID=562 RepID=UPI0021B114F3|nr:phage tail protein [Escherichia coli]